MSDNEAKVNKAVYFIGNIQHVNRDLNKVNVRQIGQLQPRDPINPLIAISGNQQRTEI